MATKAKAVNMRGLTALVVTVSFLVLLVSGIVLYVVPEGRVANWVDWEFLGLLKSDWGNLHIAFSVIFLIAAIVHLYPYNWNAFKKHVARRRAAGASGGGVRKEFVAALVLGGVVLGGSIAQLPPVSYLFDLNEWAKESWVVAPEYDPPFGHAEELSLAGFARKMHMDLEAAMGELRSKGLAFEGPRDSLAAIGKANGLSAMDVYVLIKRFEQAPEAVALASYTPELVEEKFGGTGVGRKTLAEICELTDMSIEVATARLAEAGIQATPEETAKELAAKKDLGPMDILKIVLIEGHQV